MRRVLISGAGIAGPCLAFWLRRHGFEPTLVEQAPRLRTGGYIIDFWGAGFDVAERMGLVPELLEAGYQVKEVRQVDRDGQRVSGFAVSVLDRITHGRFTSLPRGELAAALHRSLGGQVETLFDNRIEALEDHGSEVEVQFQRGSPRTFDLVVGADGLHSRVRELVFGADSRFERYLGLKVAAGTIDGYPQRDELVYLIHRDVGRQVGRFTLRGNRTMFLFIFKDPDPAVPSDGEGQKALLRSKFADMGWESADLLAALDDVEDLYLDRVSQIELDHWGKGRVTLVGDAAFAVSLLGGQGSALAMVAAYVLAGELELAEGEPALAFRRYEQRLGTFLARKQRAARKLSSFFAPNSRLGIFVGDQVLKLMGLPFVTELAVGRDLRDSIELPAV
jgi:2-polyprenyl-6-methoxyphenol hydroxylase-like FAD-dependent oxidoreductase